MYLLYWYKNTKADTLGAAGAADEDAGNRAARRKSKLNLYAAD